MFGLSVLWIFDFWFLCFVSVVFGVFLVCEACLWVKIFILGDKMNILADVVSIISMYEVFWW